MSENSMNRRVVKEINKIYCWATKVHGNQFQAAQPDILVHYCGHSLYLEGKSKGQKQTKIQKKIANDIRIRGGVSTHVFYSVEEALEIVEKWKKEVHSMLF